METAVRATPKNPARHLWLFLALTFVWAWLIWILSGVLPRGGTGVFDFRWLVAQVGVFGPSLATLAVSALTGPELRHNSLRILPVLLLPLLVPGILIALDAPAKVMEFSTVPSIAAVIVGAAVLLFFSPLSRGLLTPGTGEAQEKPDVRWVILSAVFFPGLFLIAWILVSLLRGGWGISALGTGPAGFARIVLISLAHNALLGGPLGEEIGWRGYLLPVLLKKNGFFTASLILGVVWGLWHLPIDLYAGFLVKGPGAVLFRIIWCLPLTFLITWFYVRTRGSLLVALLLHASLNTLSDFGFSNYEGSLLVLFILATIAALVLPASSQVLQERR